MRHADRLHRCAPVWCWAALAAAAVMVFPGTPAALGENAAAPAPGEQQKAKKEATAAGKDGAAASSKAAAFVGENFVVLPITTDLQRQRRKLANAKAYVIMNGPALIDEKNTTIDRKALNLGRMGNVLGPYTRSKPANVVFDVRCYAAQPPRPQAREAT